MVERAASAYGPAVSMTSRCTGSGAGAELSDTLRIIAPIQVNVFKLLGLLIVLNLNVLLDGKVGTGLVTALQ